MIVFERAEASVRAAEEEIGGRRIAARLSPYTGETGPSPVRFDPVAGTFLRRGACGGRVEVGPAEPEAWRRAASRVPAGPLLIGPACSAEPVRGAALAAAEGARAAGRPAYLLDPEVSGLPDRPGKGFVAIFASLPDELPFRRLERVAGTMPAGIVLPVLPGWTAEESFLDEVVRRAAGAGATFLVALPAAGDGESRRLAVEARGALDPGSVESYFDRVHHGDWEGESALGVARLRERALSRGLASRPPRPRADGEPAANAAAAARLEELADGDTCGEHAAARLRAAVRWIDELSRDLSPILEDGNFHRIFPFGPEIASEVEKALGAPAR